MRRSTVVMCLFAGALALALIVACSSTSSNSNASPANGTPVATLDESCSTGPPVDDPPPPPPPGEVFDSTSLECVPRCGGEAKYRALDYEAYSTLALPSGSCEHDGVRCMMAITHVQTCQGVTLGCDLSSFGCVCKDGSWHCYDVAQGGATCPICDDWDGGHTTACSTGPVAYVTYKYPPTTDETPYVNVPECVPHCGSDKIAGIAGPIYPLSALPSGECLMPFERCQFTAASGVQTCNGETHGCDVSVFGCTCQLGTWQCFSTSKGTGACTPCGDGGL